MSSHKQAVYYKPRVLQPEHGKNSVKQTKLQREYLKAAVVRG